MLTMAWQDLIGTQAAGRYTLRTLLYASNHHAEFLGVEPGEVPVTIALVQPSPEEADHELAAIDRAKQLEHRNLLHVLDGGEFSLDGARLLFIVTEAAEGTLADAIASGRAPEPAALIEDLIAGLEFLHGKGLVYRNLDPETIVRSGGHWKLADLSRLHPVGQFEPIDEGGRGVPPEASFGRILPAWDSWGLGVLLQSLFADGEHPIPAPVGAIVSGCLEQNEENRLTLPEIADLVNPQSPKPEANLVPGPDPSAPAPVEPQTVTEPEKFPDLSWDKPEPERSRVWIGLIAGALVVGALVFALVFWPRRTEPKPATPVPAAISRPAPPLETQPPVKSGDTPKPPPPAPVKTKAATGPALVGRAGYFADDLEGRLTASGERFSNQALTAAHRSLPLGSRLRVTNLKNGRSVIVRVNDRAGSARGYVITLTRRAADELGFVKSGFAKVKLQVVK